MSAPTAIDVEAAPSQAVAVRVIKLRRPTYRKPLGKLAQTAILVRQNHRCFYCRLEFGTFFRYRTKLKCVAVGWDHLLPFSYAFNSQPENIVAACYQCNAIKGDKVFDSEGEAIKYVRSQRRKKHLPVGKL